MDEFRPSFGESEAAWVAFVAAYRAQMAGRLEEALRLYKESVRLRPTAEALTFLGWTYSFMGRLEDAIAACHRAIATDPEFGNPYNDIGSYLMAQGKGAEAVEWFEKAIAAPRYEPRHFPHCNLGILFLSMGDPGRALTHLDRALAIEPGYEPARQRRRQILAQLN